MTKEQLAETLNGRQYGDEITEEESIQARQDRLVVVFGYSDDNTEFRGAFDDEIGCYHWKQIYVNQKGVLPQDHDNHCECQFCGYEAAKKNSVVLTADFRGPGFYKWETEIPHATFDIMEDGQAYCRGIVFSLDDPTIKSSAI